MNIYSTTIIFIFCKILLRYKNSYLFLEPIMKCIYCNSPTYTLSNGYKKCKVCKKKFSPKKIERKKAIKECFCKNYTINRCASTNNLSYLSVQKQYNAIRQKIAIFMEEDFINNKQIIEYDEYIYLPLTKRDKKENIFDGFNFLTYNFDNKIYNLLLPSLARYKSQLLQDKIDEIYYKEFEKFLYCNHLSNTKQGNLIKNFWQYLENFMLKFNGINNDNFFYYLKEAEFKFNGGCEKGVF